MNQGITLLGIAYEIVDYSVETLGYTEEMYILDSGNYQLTDNDVKHVSVRLGRNPDHDELALLSMAVNEILYCRF
jgi:hypothetical protein